MSVWEWVPVGLAIWFVIAIGVSLLIGPVLRHCSEAREAIEKRYRRTYVKHH